MNLGLRRKYKVEIIMAKFRPTLKTGSQRLGTIDSRKVANAK